MPANLFSGAGRRATLLHRSRDDGFALTAIPRGVDRFFALAGNSTEDPQGGHGVASGLPTGHFDERSERVAAQRLEQRGIAALGHRQERQRCFVAVCPDR